MLISSYHISYGYTTFFIYSRIIFYTPPFMNATILLCDKIRSHSRLSFSLSFLLPLYIHILYDFCSIFCDYSLSTFAFFFYWSHALQKQQQNQKVIFMWQNSFLFIGGAVCISERENVDDYVTVLKSRI